MQDEVQVKVLQVATYVGTSLSLVALTATVVIIVLLRYVISVHLLHITHTA